jgi:hypothetical protein
MEQSGVVMALHIKVIMPTGLSLGMERIGGLTALSIAESGLMICAMDKER